MDWFEQDENSVWFDAKDELDESDESFKANIPDDCEVTDEPLYKELVAPVSFYY